MDRCQLDLLLAHVPPKYRLPFEDTIERMNRLVALSLGRVETALAGGEGERVKHAARTATRAPQKLLDVASAIIHGSEVALGQDEIDDLFQDWAGEGVSGLPG